MTQKAYDRMDYAAKIRLHTQAGDWRAVPGYGDRWDIDRSNGGTVRLFVEDAGADAVKVFVFTPAPSRLLEGEMEFIGVSPRIVASTILEALR